MKKLVSLLLVLALVLGAFVPAFAATDNSADVLKKAGILTGDASGDLMLDGELNRQDMIVLLSRLLGKESTAKNYPFAPSFTDVTNGFYAPYIAWAEGEGLTTGIGENKFGFGDALTVKQLQAFLLRAMGKTVAWENVSAEANKLGLDSEASSATRQVMADLTLAALKAEGGKLAANLGVEVGATGNVLKSEVKNNTTVEITFAQDMTGAQAADFMISEDLAVENAAVKQSNNKVVILTTAKQTADTEYTISYNGQEVATFKGVAPVAVSKIELVNKANDYVVQTQNVVTAKVTPVNADDSKAGIEVTLNVVAGDNGSQLFPTVIKTAVTNAEGIATFEGYTRYAAGKDLITVYPTGSAQYRDTGAAFWGLADMLTVTPESDQSVNNQTIQTYTVTLKTSGGANAVNQPVLIALKDVTQMVEVSVPTTGIKVKNPSTTNAVKAFTDGNGSVVFNVSGTNSTATPVVWVDSSSDIYNGDNDGALDSNELQVVAGKVIFSAIQTPYVITVDKTAAFDSMKGENASYKVTVKTQDGNPYTGTISARFAEDYDSNMYTSAANVTFTTGILATDKKTTVMTLDAKGEATFKVTSAVAASATPEFWINLNSVGTTTIGAMEIGEPTIKASTVTFKSEYFDKAVLKVSDTSSMLAAGAGQTYKYRLVNQSGNTITTNLATIDRVTFTVKNVSGKTINFLPTPGAGFTLDVPGTRTLQNGETTHISGHASYTAATTTATKEVTMTLANGLDGQKLEVAAYGNGYKLNASRTPFYYNLASVTTEWKSIADLNPGATTIVTERTGEITKISTSSNYMIVKLDGYAAGVTQYAKIYFKTTDSFFVGTYADFNSLTGAPWQIFEQAVTVGDRVRVSPQTASANNTVRLINVDGSMDGTANEADPYVVAATGAFTTVATPQTLLTSNTYGPATGTTTATAGGASVTLGDASSNPFANYNMTLRNIDFGIAGNTVTIDVGVSGTATLENVTAKNVVIKSAGTSSVYLTGTTNIANLSFTNTTPVRVVTRNAAKVATATTVSGTGLVMLETEGTDATPYAKLHVLASTTVSVPTGKYTAGTIIPTATVNGIGENNSTNLTDIAVTGTGAATISFDNANTAAYTSAINSTTAQDITVTATSAIAGQTIVYAATQDGAAFAPKAGTLNTYAVADGKTVIVTVTVTSSDKTASKVHTINLVNALADSANLTSLGLVPNAGSLTGYVFASGTPNYSINASGVATVNVTPVSPTAGALITVNNIPVVSGATQAVALTNDAGTITVKVTDPGKSAITYVVTVARMNVAPTVISVTAPAGNYNAGKVIPVTVKFSEIVTVTGTPTLTLDDSIDAVVYASGSGTTDLVFNYTVGAGIDTATTLKTAAAGITVVAGTSSIKDAELADAILTGAASQTMASVVVDTTVPTVTSKTFSNATTLTIVFSEAVNAMASDFTDGKHNGAGAKTFTVDSIAGSGTTTIVLTVTGSDAIATGNTGSVDIGTTVKDLAGNAFAGSDDDVITSGF